MTRFVAICLAALFAVCTIGAAAQEQWVLLVVDFALAVVFTFRSFRP